MTSSLRRDIKAVLPGWILARVLVSMALVFVVVWTGSWTDVPTQVGEGLLSWDGTFYRDIAAHGYADVPGAPLRFFPLYPLLGRLLAPALLGHHDLALLLIANGAALVAAALLRRLALIEGLSETTADRAVWIFQLFPGAFVLVFAYSESVFLMLALASALAVRRQRWAGAAAAGYLAALTRPVGVVLLVLPVMAVVETWWRSSSRASNDEVVAPPSEPGPIPVPLPAVALSARQIGGSLLAACGPVLGLATYLTYTSIRHDDWSAPLTLQKEFRGDFVDPVSRLFRGVADLAGDERFGDGLHLPFALLGLWLTVEVLRRLDVGSGVYTAILVLAAVSADNLNSLERYLLAAFPLFFALALVELPARARAAAIVVSGGGLFSLTALALLGEYVP